MFTIAPVTRVRVSADPQAEVVAELQQGTELEVLGKKEAFLQVSAWHPRRGRVAGWVHRSFVGGQKPESVHAVDAAIVDSVVPRCHACSNANWALVPFKHDYAGGHPNIPTGFLDSIDVKARVCLGCGLVELCLDKEGRKRLTEWLKQ